MYLPIFRGRTFELLALCECVVNDILSPKILPIIEPVKASSTLITTLSSFVNDRRAISVVYNPIVGSFYKDLGRTNNKRIKDSFTALMDNEYVITSLYVGSDLGNCLCSMAARGVGIDRLILICNSPDGISYYENYIGEDVPRYNLIPDNRIFRRNIKPNRVLCEDYFPKKPRNIDYLKEESEFFSNDHIYYEDDGYIGFSDYSVVGSEYSESGFAPYAIAIHVVYFDVKRNLRIAHFVSDSNDDISDPARKYYEAVKKLVDWNRDMKLDTLGIRCFEEDYNNQNYPGLGVIKKYSIMHHMELMSKFLDGEIK